MMKLLQQIADPSVVINSVAPFVLEDADTESEAEESEDEDWLSTK